MIINEKYLSSGMSVQSIVKIVLIITFLSSSFWISAQQSQFVRVSSNGNTSIYTNLKNALWEAQDDDFIYLPGGIFTYDSLSLKKRVHLIGAGHYPDSTIYTGKTVINVSTCFIFNSATNGSIQGIEINGTVQPFEEGSFTFSKSRIGAVTFPALPGIGGGTYNFLDCVLTNWVNGISYGNGINANMIRCILLAEPGTTSNSIYRNCLFLYAITNGYMGYLMTNNQFYNNIFYINGLVSFQNGSGNSFINNHVISSNPFGGFGNSSVEINTTSESDFGATFLNVPDNTFSYTCDYHVKTTSTAYNSGNDGFQKGIYGTASPYNPNPFNPHISYNVVSPTTNAQGQIQISVKVKAQ